MKRPFAAAAALFLVVVGLGPVAAAQPSGPAQPRRAERSCPAFERSPAAMRAHMAYLADDRLQGRAPGTPGYDLAANYVATEFARLGLRPAGDGGSFLQRVPLVEYRARGGQRIVISGPRGRRTELRQGEDFTFGGWPVRSDVRLSAPMVFAGYGIVAPDGSRDDYANIDAAGKIVVVLDGAPAALPHEERAHHATFWAKQAAAERRGAVGILLLRIPLTVQGLRRWLASARPRWDPSLEGPWTLGWKSPAGEDYSVSTRLVPLGTVGAHGAARLFRNAPVSLEAIITAMAAPDGRVPTFAFPGRATASLRSETRQLAGANVAGLVEGSDPLLRRETVVLSAHLDHLGVAQWGTGDRIYNGAIDNASGVATLIEVARGLQRSARRPRRSVLLLAVTGEERGLLGSRYFVRHPTVAKAGIVANVNLDMPLLTYDFTDVVAFGSERSTIGASIARAAACVGVGISPDPAPEQGLFTRSDHYSFVQQGIPAAFLMMGSGSGGQAALQAFLAGCYHKPCDDMTQAINFDAAARFAHLNYALASDLADAPERPRWRRSDFFGRLYAPGAPTAD